jgi:putative peptidoglycan binding protein/CHAP domain-containing protein
MTIELHVTSPLMHGEAVLQIQKRLAQLGYAPGIADGAYGPTTAAAVNAFQRDHDLNVDGIVGPQTLAALEVATPPPAGTVPPAIAPSAIGLKALQKALEFVGVKEDPPGSNRTQFGQWYGIDGVPWCNIFVSYCFQLGAGYTIADGFKGAGVMLGKGCAYVPTTEHWLNAVNLWVGRTDPQPGDIAIFNWDGGKPDHIGIVQKYLGNGEFTTVEGNTSLRSDSNGGEVMIRNRFLRQVDGFGRIS